MIVLDTNVISEMMRAPDRRSSQVFDWLAEQDGESLFTTSFTLAEIWFGLELLPVGKRRNALHAKALEVFDIGFRDRVLDYTKAAARTFARIAAGRTRQGLHVPGTDIMIAAIAANHGMAVATRNLGDFTDCGVTIINPWDYKAP